MILSDLTQFVRAGQFLQIDQCSGAIEALLSNSYPQDQKADFLVAQMDRGLDETELFGFAQAVLPRSLSPTFIKQWQGVDIMDCCGTGGGGLNILNVSTGIVFILAAAGVPVVKHGNRGITKKSGSADVLETLGLKIDQTPAQLADSISRLGWGFVYAPHYHPSFKTISPVRKMLGEKGWKTIFNFLGPLINPVRPNAQLVGVFDSALLPIYYSALSKLGCAKPCIVFGQDHLGRALGEVSFQSNKFCPSSFNLPDAATPPAEPLESIIVGDSEESAGKLERILKREETGLGYRLLTENAAVAFWVHGRVTNYAEGLELATATIASNAAYKLLQRSREWATDQK